LKLHNSLVLELAEAYSKGNLNKAAYFQNKKNTLLRKDVMG